MFCHTNFLMGISSRDIGFYWPNFPLGGEQGSRNNTFNTQDLNSPPKYTRDTLPTHVFSRRCSSADSLPLEPIAFWWHYSLIQKYKHRFRDLFYNSSSDLSWPGRSASRFSILNYFWTHFANRLRNGSRLDRNKLWKLGFKRSLFCYKVNNQKPPPFPKSIICKRINRCFGDTGVIKRKMANDFFMGQLLSWCDSGKGSPRL